MIQQLLEMPTEELRNLLPIRVKEHNPNYNKWYEIEKQDIINAVKHENVARINHIGSSAVKGLIAKPIVDITLEIDGTCNVTQLSDDLMTIGYELLRRGDDPMGIMFVKGYSIGGFAEKVFHLHVKYMGDWNELYLRDYLMTHPEAVTEYGNLKLKILEHIDHNTAIFEHDYGDAKTDLIQKYTLAGKKEFKDRYKPK